jgi:hypothetical protein
VNAAALFASSPRTALKTTRLARAPYVSAQCPNMVLVFWSFLRVINDEYLDSRLPGLLRTSSRPLPSPSPLTRAPWPGLIDAPSNAGRTVPVSAWTYARAVIATTHTNSPTVTMPTTNPSVTSIPLIVPAGSCPSTVVSLSMLICASYLSTCGVRGRSMRRNSCVCGQEMSKFAEWSAVDIS